MRSNVGIDVEGRGIHRLQQAPAHYPASVQHKRVASLGCMPAPQYQASRSIAGDHAGHIHRRPDLAASIKDNHDGTWRPAGAGLIPY